MENDIQPYKVKHMVTYIMVCKESNKVIYKLLCKVIYMVIYRANDIQ